ncbi:MAG: DUF3310 domain-containing protein [Pelagibacteraceae bacterium]|jgi:hypothetical protein
MESDDPKHYKKQTQTWDAIISQLSDQEVVGYLKGSAAKHLFRSGEKHGGGLSSTIMDIKKAKKYIEKLLEFLIQSKMIEKNLFKHIEDAEKAIKDNNITKLFEKDKDE